MLLVPASTSRMGGISKMRTSSKKGTRDNNQPQEWLRHSYAVQSKLLEDHPRRAELDDIGKLISEEIVQILGAFLRERHINTFQQRVKEEPTVLAREIGEYVGGSVARIMAADPDWPVGSIGATCHRREIVVLTPGEIESLVRHAWYMNAAAFSSWEHERRERPGWEYHWLYHRVRKLGVLVDGPVGSQGGPGGGKRAAPNLEYVVVSKDGSALVKFEGAPIVTHAALEPEQRLPVLVTRRYRRSPNAAQWRNEITHRLIDGKFVRIKDTEREEQ